MISTSHKWYSPRLGQDFEMKTYGRAGKPLIVFPSMGGRFFDFENFGMVEACGPLLDAGKVRIYAVDGRDWESWLNEGISIADRGRRHEQWDSCIVQEALPFVRDHSWRGTGRDLMVTGCSAGGYHAANFFFRHPDVCDTVVALSGVYQLENMKPLRGAFDEGVYFNDPLMYLPNLADEGTLSLYRRSSIVICVGQGAWEDICLADSRRLSDVLNAKGIPHWLDLWGADVNHDWPWWRKQLPYHLGRLLG